MKKIVSLVCGILCTVMVICGICLLFVPKPVATVLGIVVTCLSLACGLILINPIFLLPLIVGVFMIVFPVPTGIVLVCLGTAGAVANAARWHTKHRQALA